MQLLQKTALKSTVSALYPLTDEYQNEVHQIKRKLDELHTKTNTFTKVSDTCSTFQIRNNSPFDIRTLVSYSASINHEHPAIWYTESICPGSPEMVFDSWINPKYRLQWDGRLADLRKIDIDENNSNIYILHSITKAAAGGLISPRDFVDLIAVYDLSNEQTEYEAIQLVAKSIERRDVPPQVAYVRGTVLLSGVLFEKMSDEQIKEMNLLDENEWTRIRYIIQTNIGGWIPLSIIHGAMSSANNDMMQELRMFVKQRLDDITEDRI